MPDGERLLELARILRDKTGHLVRLEEPLVRIQRDRSGALNPAQEPFAPLGHDSEPAVCRVDVHPESLRLAEVRRRVQRIDSSRAGRAGVGAHREGIESCSTLGGHRALERRHVKAAAFVTRQDAN